VILALPIAAYYCQLKGWSVWGGLPAPFSVIPDTGALSAYGLFFGFGWVLQRQQLLLLEVEKRWFQHGLLAVVAWVVCHVEGGWMPHWGAFLKGPALLIYTMSYLVAAWAGSFALVGVAMRYLSGFSSVRRYLADSSYWLYLTHIPVLVFFEALLHPFPWHPVVKFLATIGVTLPILLLSYHYLVRFTFLGATLNGRRHARPGATKPRGAVSA
jgi:hypothetical protein